MKTTNAQNTIAKYLQYNNTVSFGIRYVKPNEILDIILILETKEYLS
jgi:hypothetical protein